MLRELNPSLPALELAIRDKVRRKLSADSVCCRFAPKKEFVILDWTQEMFALGLKSTLAES